MPCSHILMPILQFACYLMINGLSWNCALCWPFSVMLRSVRAYYYDDCDVIDILFATLQHDQHKSLLHFVMRGSIVAGPHDLAIKLSAQRLKFFGPNASSLQEQDRFVGWAQQINLAASLTSSAGGQADHHMDASFSIPVTASLY
jgi:hypothetical protein